MAQLILCTSKTAETPFTFLNTKVEIYTYEELCFYIYNNTVLISKSALSDKLFNWIREELGMGSRKAGLELCGFSDDKPVLMVIGGSLGAQSVNETVRFALPRLLPDFNVVHICGKEKMDQPR